MSVCPFVIFHECMKGSHVELNLAAYLIENFLFEGILVLTSLGYITSFSKYDRFIPEEARTFLRKLLLVSNYLLG